MYCVIWGCCTEHPDGLPRNGSSWTNVIIRTDEQQSYLLGLVPQPMNQGLAWWPSWLNSLAWFHSPQLTLHSSCPSCRIRWSPAIWQGCPMLHSWFIYAPNCAITEQPEYSLMFWFRTSTNVSHHLTIRVFNMITSQKSLRSQDIAFGYNLCIYS